MKYKIQDTEYRIQNTKYKIQNTKYRFRGQSLVEILVAIAVATIMIGGSSTLMALSLRVFRSSRERYDVNTLLRQQSESTIALANSNWHTIGDLVPGIHYKIVKRGNSLALQAGEERVFPNDSGLVAYWNFDEATSTTAYDNSGNTNNGALTNGPTWQSSSNCVSGPCLSFDGSNDYVDIADSNSLDLTEKISITAWIKPTDTNDKVIVAKRDNSNYAWEFSISTDASGNKLLGRINSNNNEAVSTRSIEENKWTYVAMTYDKSQIKVYIDGVEENTYGYTSTISTNNVDVSIGRRMHSTAPSYFNGLIDEVRIYNRALSAEEIKNHYNAGLDKLGLVSYWAMDEGGDTIAYDTQSTNNGTLYNGPTWQSSSNCVSGPCLSFDGSNDYVGFGDLDFDYPEFTVELWAKSYSASQAHVTNLIGKGDWNNTNDWYLGYKSGTSLSFVYGVGWTAGPSYPISSFDLTQWHHIAGVAKTNKLELYLDGNLVDSKILTHSSVSNDYELQIARSSYYAEYFDGRIDEVRIYNRALSADEITHHYEAGADRYLVFNKVSRTSGNIDTTYISANDDPATKRVFSIVKSGQGLVGPNGVQQLNFYLTRSSNNQVIQQTDWSGGPGQTGPIPNPGNKFDSSDSNINYASTTGSIYQTTATSTVASLTSSIIDTGVSGGAGFNSLLWQGSLGTGGAVKFQIAFSNATSGPWTYYGPTATSDYYQPNPNVSIAFPTAGSASPQNMRYIRYKVYLSTTGATPQVNDIIINWSP